MLHPYEVKTRVSVTSTITESDPSSGASSGYYGYFQQRSARIQQKRGP